MVLTLAALVATYLPAKAGFIDTVTPNGTDQEYEDISREHVFFNGNAAFTAGSDIVGFSQINTKTGGPTTPNNIYVVFALRVTSTGSPSPQSVDFGAVPDASPTSLASILGPTFAGTSLALFDLPQGTQFPKNLVNEAPSAAATINDYLKFIQANGNLEFGTGFVNPDTFFQALTQFPLTPADITPAALNSATTATTLGSFDGALDITFNNTGLKFNDTMGGVLNQNGTLSFTQFAVVSGSIRGGSNDVSGTYPNYGNPGVQDNASFVVNVSKVVPEPASMILFGIGSLGVMGMVHRRRQKAVVA
jgi:hypothetical protein